MLVFFMPIFPLGLRVRTAIRTAILEYRQARRNRRHRMSSLAIIKLALRSQESIILIMNDDIAKRVAVAWKIYRPDFKERAGKSKEDAYEGIARLWNGIGQVDFDRLAMIAGLPVTKVAKAFGRLRAANIIWPDGTMSEEARKIIVGEINVHLMPMIPKAPAAPKPEKGKTDDGKRTGTKNKKIDRKSGSSKARM